MLGVKEMKNQKKSLYHVKGCLMKIKCWLANYHSNITNWSNLNLHTIFCIICFMITTPLHTYAICANCAWVHHWHLKRWSPIKVHLLLPCGRLKRMMINYLGVATVWHAGKTLLIAWERSYSIFHIFSWNKCFEGNTF